MEASQRSCTCDSSYAATQGKQVSCLPCVQFENVSFSYPHLSLLENASCSIPYGAYVGIIGANGVGKSTMLKLLLHEFCVTAGKISIFGTQVAQLKSFREIGYVPQFVRNTSFPATAREIIEMNLYARAGLFKHVSKSDRAYLDTIIDFTGVSEFQDRMFASLSGGQMKRVMLARALVVQPKLVLLDEPAAGLDLDAQNLLYSLLREANQTLKTTILMVTHDPDALKSDVSFFLELKNKQLIYQEVAQ